MTHAVELIVVVRQSRVCAVDVDHNLLLVGRIVRDAGFRAILELGFGLSPGIVIGQRRDFIVAVLQLRQLPSRIMRVGHSADIRDIHRGSLTDLVVRQRDDLVVGLFGFLLSVQIVIDRCVLPRHAIRI